MNILKSTIRILTLVTLFAAAFYCILSQPNAADITRWVTTLVISKSIGVACLLVSAFLYLRWIKTDKWIAIYHRWCMKGYDK